MDENIEGHRCVVKRHIEEDEQEEPIDLKRFKSDSEERDVYRAGILDLPNEILIKLFRYLDSTDIISLDLTCKRFANIATTSSLWKDFDLYNPSLDYKQYTDYLMRAHSGTWRVRIDCGDSLREFTTPCFMKWLKSTCPSLTVLHLHNQMIDTRQMKLETFPLTLKELSLMNVKAYSSRVLPSEFFRNIDKLFVNLETLVLSGCDWFNPHCILVVSKLPKLKHLNLYKCKTSNCMPYFSLATRLGFPKLETIDLRQTGIGDSEVACFNSVKTLRCLYLEARRPEHFEEKVIPESPPSKQCSFCGKHTLRYNKEESTYRYTIAGDSNTVHRIPTSSGQTPPEVTHIFPADERTPFAHSLIHSNYIENIIDFNNERAFNLHRCRYQTDAEDLSRPSNQDEAPRPPEPSNVTKSLHITIPKSNINIIFPENKWGVTRSSNSDPRTNVTINGRTVEADTDNQTGRTDDDATKKSDNQNASESNEIETTDNGDRIVKSDLLKKIDNHCVNVDREQKINKDGGKTDDSKVCSEGESSFEIGLRCNNSNSNSDSDGESGFEIGLRYKNSTKNSGLATNKRSLDTRSASPVPGCSYSESGSTSPVAGCSYSQPAAGKRRKRAHSEEDNDSNKPANDTPLLKIVKNFFEKDGSKPSASNSNQNTEERAEPSPEGDSVRDNNNEPEADNSGSVVISVRFSETGPRWAPMRPFPLARVTLYPLQSPEGTINNNTIISLFYNNTSCVNLERLSLTGYTDINDRSLESIATSNILLRYLDVRRTSVTLDGCVRFKLLRPDCEVISDFGLPLLEKCFDI